MDKLKNNGQFTDNFFFELFEKPRLEAEAKRKAFNLETERLLTDIPKSDINRCLKALYRDDPKTLDFLFAQMKRNEREFDQVFGLHLDQLKEKKQYLESSVEQLEKLFKEDHFIMSIPKTANDEYKPLKILTLFVDMISLQHPNFESVPKIRSEGRSHVLFIKLTKDYGLDFFNQTFSRFVKILAGEIPPTTGFSSEQSARKFLDKYLITLMGHLPEDKLRGIIVVADKVVTNNNINFRNAKDSIIQIGDGNINNIANIKNVTEIRDKILEYLPQLTDLSNQDRHVILQNIDSINSELSKSTPPNFFATNEALISIRSILEGITGSVIASGLLALF